MSLSISFPKTARGRRRSLLGVTAGAAVVLASGVAWALLTFTIERTSDRTPTTVASTEGVQVPRQYLHGISAMTREQWDAGAAGVSVSEGEAAVPSLTPAERQYVAGIVGMTPGQLAAG
jgi:hypothetical protein